MICAKDANNFYNQFNCLKKQLKKKKILRKFTKRKLKVIIKNLRYVTKIVFSVSKHIALFKTRNKKHTQNEVVNKQ